MTMTLREGEGRVVIEKGARLDRATVQRRTQPAREQVAAIIGHLLRVGIAPEALRQRRIVERPRR